ncbi:EamA family transporter [Actinocatenispora rupis]|uniref:Membrane protein n=1 Tax=Actinocatenispora rupis TaxID=519421 RepID=A0A8J3J6Z1_9ACTN|nr:EamA family transporter [Actinocatenispora rupis]GID15263.1 membrane protein [Actinocatenispora rupis]
MGAAPFRTPTAGLGLAVASALAFGGSGPVAKPLIDAGLSPLSVAWLRVAGAALLLLPLAVRHLGALRRRPVAIVGYGLFAVAGVQSCYFAAIARIPVGVALLVEYLAPVLVLAFVRVVLRRRVSRAALVGVVLAVVGLANVVEVWSGARFDLLGLGLALAAACCQVVYFVLSESAGDGVGPVAMLGPGLLVGAVAMTVVARPWSMPWHLLTTAPEVRGHAVPAIVLVAWIAVVATVVAYLTGIAAVRRLSAPVASTVATLEAVIAALLAWLLLGEAMDAVQIGGGVLVLAGAVVAQRATPATAPEPEPVPVGS